MKHDGEADEEQNASWECLDIRDQSRILIDLRDNAPRRVRLHPPSTHRWVKVVRGWGLLGRKAAINREGAIGAHRLSQSRAESERRRFRAASATRLSRGGRAGIVSSEQFGYCASVCLAVGVDGYALKPHKFARHHIGRQTSTAGSEQI